MASVGRLSNAIRMSKGYTMPSATCASTFSLLPLPNAMSTLFQTMALSAGVIGPPAGVALSVGDATMT